MDRSRHAVTKCLSDEKTHVANKSKLFKKLNHVNKTSYEVELGKAEIEHKEPITFSFFFLQYAYFRILELYYNFSSKLCDLKNFEELKTDTGSQYLALAAKDPEKRIRPE